MELNFYNMRTAYDIIIQALKNDDVVKAVISQQDSLIKILENTAAIYKEEDITGIKRIINTEGEVVNIRDKIGRVNDRDLKNLYTNMTLDTVLLNLVMTSIYLEVENRYDRLFSNLCTYEEGNIDFHYKVYKTINQEQRLFLQDYRSESLSVLERFLDKNKSKAAQSNKSKIEFALSNVYDALRVYYSHRICVNTILKREGAYELEQ